ncbi:MAG: hypothetical protein ACHQPI_00350 [Thermoanaerobaculia bacterium]
MKQLIARFEEAVRDRPSDGRAPLRPPSIPSSRIDDPLLLARLHDAALFLRAFPRRTVDLAVSEGILREIPARMKSFARRSVDLSGLDDFVGVGIGGTSLTMEFSWGMARWLARRWGRAVSIAWDEFESPARLAPALSRLLPFLPERSLADVGIDYMAWLSAALPHGRGDGGLRLLVDAFDRTDEDDDRRAERWDVLGLPVRWRLGASPASRTLARLSGGPLFVDSKPLLARRDVSDVTMDGAAAPAPRIRRLDLRAGEAFLDAARAAVGVRYRELHAFTWGNPRDVVRGDVGRGLSVWCCGILPAHRLPLRAGYGFLLARNGVPIGYGDAYALGDRLDLSFNVFYAFRDGESAFAYARTVAFFSAFLGTRSVFIDPYQIGRDNEEAIQSGAFWFYRKLGFRSVDRAIEKLVLREEERTTRHPGRRTTPATLRRIAQAAVLLDRSGRRAPVWSAVSLNGVGLAIQRRMAASRLAPGAFRAAAERRVADALALGFRPDALPSSVARAFSGLAPVLDLLPTLSHRSEEERALLGALVRRKAAAREAGFVRALARARFLAESLTRFDPDA